MAKKTESFYSQLTNLFRSGPAIRRKVKGKPDTGVYDKAAVLGMGNHMGLPVGKGTGQLNLMGGSDSMSRQARNIEYAEMEQTPIISKALDIIADEACSGDEKGKNFHVYSDNPNIKAALEDLFFDVLNVDFDLRVWVRNLVKYGEVFLYLEVAPGVGIVNAKPMYVSEVKRIEDFDPNDPYAIQFVWERFGQKKLENWQVCHFRILGNDLYYPYGTSMLDSARRFWRQYIMMIDAMLVYRLVRSPERRVFYVDIGNADPNSIPTYVNAVMSTIKGNNAVDKQTGRLDERYNPISVDEDYIVPVRGNNSGTKIDTLAGGQYATAVEDIEIIQSQLFAALGIPKAYLGYDEALSSKATLAQEDVRFSRTIQILQKIVISELNKLAILHLYSLGFAGKDLIDFKLKMSNPSTVALQQKLDVWKSKIDLVAAINQIEEKFLPMDLVYKDILEFTDDQIAYCREKLKEDKRFKITLDSIVEPEEVTPDSQVDPFDPTHYNLPAGQRPVNLGSTTPITASSEQQSKDAVHFSKDESEPLKMPLGGNTTPIKDNPEVSREKKNKVRRLSDLDKLATTANLSGMLNARTSLSLRDPYDKNFLKNPLRESEEELRKQIFGETSRELNLPKSVSSILERFEANTNRTQVLKEQKEELENGLKKDLIKIAKPTTGSLIEEQIDLSSEIPLNEFNLSSEETPYIKD